MLFALMIESSSFIRRRESIRHTRCTLVNAVDISGATALHCAAERNNNEIVRFLLSHGAA